MMRALYTAATGMIAEQTNLDTISNNLSNVNTNGYKTERTEFKSLLYQTLQTKTTTANGEQKPVCILRDPCLQVRMIQISQLKEMDSFQFGQWTDRFIIREMVTLPGVLPRMEEPCWQILKETQC